MTYFPNGTRVALNKAWGKWTAFAPFKHYPEGREGQVAGTKHNDKQCLRVLFDGNKWPTTFHYMFLTEVK